MLFQCAGNNEKFHQCYYQINILKISYLIEIIPFTVFFPFRQLLHVRGRLKMVSKVN